MFRDLVGLFVVLNVADLILTSRLLSRLGPIAEENPVAALLYVEYGATGLVLLKALSTVVAVGSVVLLRKVGYRYSPLILVFGCVLLGIAVGFGIYLNWLMWSRYDRPVQYHQFQSRQTRS